ncbi:hypothetical protein KUCAC02_032839 [Chaenocephalus aceratus]|nr:hypothetical protein KUCAC02_032839 [Chaenocephalus aceratus]
MSEPESLRGSSARNRTCPQAKHAEARELMYNGALLFFSHNQQNSAADLSMLVLEVFEKSEVKVEDELLECLAKLFSRMEPNSPERVAFVSRALKWSTGGPGKLGHPKLNTSCWLSPCGKNKTTVSLVTTSCTRLTVRAAHRCWSSIQRHEASAARSTCLWRQAVYSE